MPFKCDRGLVTRRDRFCNYERSEVISNSQSIAVPLFLILESTSLLFAKNGGTMTDRSVIFIKGFHG
jgi:hypothetical protein